VNEEAFGHISPTAFNADTSPGLSVADGAKQAGFLFKITDTAGQVAMSLDRDSRDAVLVRVTTTLGDPFEVAVGLSNSGTGASANDRVYVGISQEGKLRSLDSDAYPAAANNGTAPTASATGGLVAVGLGTRDADAIESGMGTICVDVDGNGTCEREYTFSVAGAVDGEMSFVGPVIRGPHNLEEGKAHVRAIMLRDKNNVPVNGMAGEISVKNVKDSNLGFAGGASAEKAEDAAENRDDPDTTDIVETDHLPPTELTLSEGTGEDGVYHLGITALTGTAGLHAFEVTIGSGNAELTKTNDSDGNPLEAHIAGGITGLTIEAVSNRDGDVEVTNGEISVTPLDRITITVRAESGDHGRPPHNGSEVTLVRDDSDRELTETTNDHGEVNFTLRAGRADHGVDLLSGNKYLAALTVRVADADAPAADTGPTNYVLADTAGGNFHVWAGGDASSAEFENVANLVNVWKWTGNMWFNYVSDPGAPATIKTSYTLSDGDVLWVNTNGPVSITLGD